MINIICKTMLFIGISLYTLTSYSQVKKVLIVSLADTTIVHCHIGTTAITNFTDSLRLDTSISKFIEDKLTQYLESSFEVKIINAPEEIRKNAFGFWGQSKEYKNWIAEIQKGYDILVVINNIDISNELSNAPIPKNTSGFYSRGRLHGVYTTISYDAFRISDNKRLEYYNMGSKVFVQLKDFKMPTDKRTFDYEMIETMKAELLNQLDNRIKYFLTKTYLLPNIE